MAPPPPPTTTQNRPSASSTKSANHLRPPTRCFRILAFTSVSILTVYALVGMTIHIYDLVNEESPHGSWPFNPRPAKITLVILQTFFLIAFIFASFGTWRKNRNYYFWACLLLLGVAVILTIFGVVTVRASQTAFETKIMQQLEKGEKEDFHWIDFIQQYHKCCGIDSYQNWARINGKLYPNQDGRKGVALNEDSLPGSCCKQETTPPPKSDCGVDIISRENFTDMIYVKPCGPEIIRNASKTLINLGAEMLVVAFITLSVALFLYCGASEIFCLAPRLSNQGQNGQNSSGSRAASATSIYLDRDDEVDDLNTLEGEEQRYHFGGGKKRSGDADAENSGSRRRRSREKRVGIDSKGNILVGDAKPKTVGVGGANNKKGSQMSHYQDKQKGIITNIIKEINNNKMTTKWKMDELIPVINVETTSIKSKNKEKQRFFGRANKLQSVVGGEKRQVNTGFSNGGGISRPNDRAIQTLQKMGQQKSSTKNASPSRLSNGTRSDNFLQNLEMLYVGVGKNVSTLSTTPNPSGSLFFPWSNSMNNSSPPPTAPTVPPPMPKSTGNKGNNKGKGISQCSSVPHLPHGRQSSNNNYNSHYNKAEFLIPSYHNTTIQDRRPKQHLEVLQFIPPPPEEHVPLSDPDTDVKVVDIMEILEQENMEEDRQLAERDSNAEEDSNYGLVQSVPTSFPSVIPEPEVLPEIEDLNPIVRSSSSTMLNIPSEGAPAVPVEVTNVINLINSPDEPENDGFVTPSPPPVALTPAYSDSSVQAMSISSSSLGFESSCANGSISPGGAGESSAGESDEEITTTTTMDNNEDNLLSLTIQKSKVRFLTLPTIEEEEPEPNTPKKEESPTGSDGELHKNSQVIEIEDDKLGNNENNSPNDSLMMDLLSNNLFGAQNPLEMQIQNSNVQN